MNSKQADQIMHNERLCASVRRLYASGQWSLEQLGAELRRTGAKRGYRLTPSEAVAIVDAILGDEVAFILESQEVAS